MSKGISLHIGLNYVDPAAYGGWDGELAGCINDANAMQAIANSRGFSTQKLIDAQANCANVVAKISDAAEQLASGDIFLLTYSGHGGQLPDTDNQEDDAMDETWVLWDRELLDDELYRLWSRFKAGVRLFITSDSCHSGTVVRMMLRQQLRQRGNGRQTLELDSLAQISKLRVREGVSMTTPETLTQQRAPRPRFIPPDVSIRSYQQKKELYRYIRGMAGPRSDNPIAASLIFISGCQDNQYSYDGDANGLFTSKLLQVWNNGSFASGHASFFSSILALMPDYQTPNFLKLGVELTEFEAQRPFTVQFTGTSTGTGTGASTGGTTGGEQTTAPRVTGPAAWGSNNESPVFSIYKGENPYYYFEIAADPQLFDSTNHGSERMGHNFYASWADPAVSNRLTSQDFKLPDNAWELLRTAERLSYRIGTTSSSSIYEWDNFMVSTGDKEGHLAPSMLIVSQAVNPQQPQPAGAGGASNIIDSVGLQGKNLEADVRIIQGLLNQVPAHEGGPTPKLVVDGKVGPKTIAAISHYQENIGEEASGLILPGSPSLLQLQATRGVTQQV